MEGRPLRILLVEDNPDHAELVLRGLEDHHVGNDLVHVPDGEEALDYLFRRGRYGDPGLSPRPDLVLLDLRLPKVDGLEVLRQIKEAPGEVGRLPVVILTTSQGETDLARAYDHHANSYLVKPLDFPRFTDLMRDLGYYWLVWNRRPQEKG